MTTPSWRHATCSRASGATSTRRLGHFHTGLAAIIEELEHPAEGRHSQHRAADALHDLEFTLLRSTQATADQVVAAAHAEAEAIIARARLEAERTSELAQRSHQQ